MNDAYAWILVTVLILPYVLVLFLPWITELEREAYEKKECECCKHGDCSRKEEHGAGEADNRDA
ncbi:MAG: hypothetical protein EHM87_24755 [Burkholderiales bacterium]|nr:MAG: hypothetical protein EHM87_24755 [Burkholderiales bacterium]